MSSNTSASLPVGWSYSTSSRVITCWFGLSRRNAWISRKLFTCLRCERFGVAVAAVAVVGDDGGGGISFDK